MSSKKARSPQEKKALSYARDGRNTYGENDKAARRLIPLRKAQENRQVRRKVTQEMAALPALSREAADLVESSARHDVHRIGGWTKGSDAPLGLIVAWRREGLVFRAGRKLMSRLREASRRLASG